MVARSAAKDASGAATSEPAREQVARAAVLMVSGQACFVAMAALVKLASDEATPMQAALFRSIVTIPPVLGAMLMAREPVRSPRWRLLVWRGVIGFSALACYLWSVAHAELASVVALQQLSPMFVAVLSVWWLGERPRPIHWALAAVCLGGALLVVRPTRGVASLGAAAALLSAVLSALAYVSVRRLTRTEPTSRIVLWFSAVATLLALPLALADWHALSDRSIGVLVIAGLFAAAGQSMMTASYRRARAHVAAVFAYASVPFGYLLGIVGWGEHPDALGTAGITIIALAGIVIVRSQRTPTAQA